MNDKEKFLRTALERYRVSKEALDENYKNALEDIKFARLGEQWPDSIKARRMAKGRPCLTINLLPPFIKQVVNDIRQSNPSIVVHPVDDKADEETARIMNGIIRQIEQNSSASVAYDEAADDAVTCGIGFFRIALEYADIDAFDLDVKISKIANPLSVFFDADSTASDSSDWNYCFILDVMSKEAFEDAYPNAEITEWDEDDFIEDWVEDKMITVAEYWVKEMVDSEIYELMNGMITTKELYDENPGMGEIKRSRKTRVPKVKQYIITATDILEDAVEWPGKTIPIIPVFGEEVNVENKRYWFGLTHQLKDVQRNFNYWRSMSTEMIALAPKAPYIGKVGSFKTDKRKWETANSESWPFMEYDGDQPPQRQPFDAVPAGALQEATNAATDIRQLLGMHESAMGAPTTEVAGVAIRQKRQESENVTFHFADNLARAIAYAGRILLDVIPAIYTEPKVLRILGEDNQPKQVPVNQPPTPTNGIDRIYDLAAGKYDLVVKTGPQYATLREESSKQMMDLIKAVPALSQYVADLFADSLDWPGAQTIAKRLRALLPPQIQAMEKLDHLPPEAQSMIASLMGELQKGKQAMEQLKMTVGEQDAQIKSLIIESQSNKNEISQKELDSKRKYDASIKKMEIEAQLARAKTANDNSQKDQEKIFKALMQRSEQDFKKELEVLKGQIDAMSEDMSALRRIEDKITQAIENGDVQGKIEVIGGNKPLP